MNVLEILSTRFSQLELKGFRTGYFDATGTKLMAYTLLPVRDPDYEDLYHFHLKDGGHSYVLKSADDTRHHIDLGNGTYKTKGYAQMVEEGILHFVRMWFYGAFHENEWYILRECRYYSEEDEAKILCDIERELCSGGDEWDGGVFNILPEYEEKIDFEKAASMLSAQTGKLLNQFHDYREVGAFVEQMAKDRIPMHRVKQPPNFRQFVGKPWVVAYQKQEIKEKINRQFEAYINEAVFVPLVKMMKIHRKDEFAETYSLYHPDYFPLIYPHSKEQVICIVKAVSKAGNSRLYYFMHLVAAKKIFEWTLPTPASAAGHHAFYIIDDIKNLSTWGNEFDLSDPSITMDDPQFWNEYVLKKENSDYKYLKPIQVQNHQADIYPLF